MNHLARAITVVVMSVMTAVTARAAETIPPLAHHPSPIISAGGPAPAGAAPVTIDFERLGVAAAEPGAFIIDQMPVGAGVVRSLAVRRIDADPSLVVEVVTNVGVGGLSLSHFTAEERAEAAGLIFAGTVVGKPDSRAILSFGPAGLFALIDDGDKRFVISSGPVGAGRVPLAFEASAIAPELLPMADWTCFTEDAAPKGVPWAGGVADTTIPCRQFRVAAETDFEYFQLLGGNPLAAANYALLQMVAAGEILTGGPNARIGLTYLRLWATAADPWDAASASAQLQQFRTHWQAAMTGVERDVAHFLSGRVLGGGVAWTAKLCTTWCYSLSGNLNGYFPYPLVNNHPQNWDVIVVTHEIAHNLGAIHTHQHGIDSPDLCGFGECQVASQGTIMSYCYICPGGMANIKLSFAPISITTMLAYLNGIACGFTPPLVSLVAVDDYTSAAGGQSIELDLLANDKPANCGPVSFAALDAISVAGGSIVPTGAPGVVKYTAPFGFVGGDFFAYTIQGSGIPAIGQVFISVSGLTADLNGDGVVNGNDLAVMLGVWASSSPTADLNSDGVVNGIDLSILMGAWQG